MLKQPLQKIKDRIKARPDNVFTWISYQDAHGFPTHRSIKLNTESALAWCDAAAEDCKGHVPCFLGEDIFLGVCPSVGTLDSLD